MLGGVMLISQGRDVNIPGIAYSLRMPGAKDVLPSAWYKKEQPEKVMASLENKTQEKVVVSKQPKEEKRKVVKDTLTSSKPEVIVPKEGVKVTTHPGDIAIEYPQGALDAFFSSLSYAKGGKKKIRVLHFGDSQLEGDRVTERLRENVQGEFGGYGLGLIPFTEIKGIRTTLNQEASDNWETDILYGHHAAGATHGEFGLFGKDFFFKGSFEEPASAEIRLQRTGYTSYRERTYRHIKLYLKNTLSPLKVIYGQGKKYTDTLKVYPRENPQTLDLPIKGRLGTLDMKFESTGTPHFYGLSLEGDAGVMVDNLPLRGSSGTEFTRMYKAHLKGVVKDMSVRLIILQFGVNTVPQLSDSYGFYERSFYRQIQYLKSVFPKASILVVGVSDMARKERTELQSYPNITAVSGAQRRAAQKAGVAFWDLYKAMGGEGSIITWAERTPAWANKDYTHFTRRGANHVGDMIYNELMREYNKFLTKKIAQ
ncbi:SGNH/GDSL hydrolase family protein [Algivirga pacifica]|uniref:SGNH/GDSL hydrolase family protein n=2 Tax=Algivirga pacifica TaxID=1162670 RepID=A0ABP9DHK9_9BACT